MTDEQSVDVATVPRALLAAVLDKAQADLWYVHDDFCLSSDRDADGRHSCDKHQESIDALRAAASGDASA